MRALLPILGAYHDHTVHEHLWRCELGKCASSAHEDVTFVGRMFHFLCGYLVGTWQLF